jgi:hypothetical protein
MVWRAVCFTFNGWKQIRWFDCRSYVFGRNGMSLPILKILMHLFYKSFVLEKHAFKYDAWCISSVFTTHKTRCHSLPLKEFELSSNFCLKYDFISAEWRDFD